jgi:hypothetical protein
VSSRCTGSLLVDFTSFAAKPPPPPRVLVERTGMVGAGEQLTCELSLGSDSTVVPGTTIFPSSGDKQPLSFFPIPPNPFTHPLPPPFADGPCADHGCGSRWSDVRNPPGTRNPSGPVVDSLRFWWDDLRSAGEPTFNPRARAVNCGRRKPVHAAHRSQAAAAVVCCRVPASAVRAVPSGARQRGCSGRVRGVTSHTQRGGVRPP